LYRALGFVFDFDIRIAYGRIAWIGDNASQTAGGRGLGSQLNLRMKSLEERPKATSMSVAISSNQPTRFDRGRPEVR